MNVLEFLTNLFNKGASFSTLNTCRSAIAQIAGPTISQDFRLKRFFKGVYGLRPPLPKYENTWDPAIVLRFVKNLNNSDISLELLTHKLCILLALATGQRIQTLAKIEISNIDIGQGKIEIKIPQRLKTSAHNRSQPVLILPFFDQDPQICVARTLISYMEKTANIRGSAKALFITYKRPHHEASTQTIGRWLKSILAKSGLDTNVFSAHSTRHASTSAAARRGISFDTIRLAAGWTESSRTFATCYNRPLISQTEFARGVLTT